MRYEKGSFVLVPNKSQLAEKKSHVQCTYFWICSYADADGLCFPSRSTLARLVGCSLPTIDSALHELCECGLLKKTNRFKENEQKTNLYQIQLLEGGSQGGLPPSQGGLLGVAKEVSTELNPVLTQSTEETARADFYEIIPEEGEEPKKKAKRDQQAFQIKSMCYDRIEEEYGARPTDTFADYIRVLEARKVLKDPDILALVDDALAKGKAKTLREMLTARAIDIYRQENL